MILAAALIYVCTPMYVRIFYANVLRQLLIPLEKQPNYLFYDASLPQMTPYLHFTWSD